MFFADRLPRSISRLAMHRVPELAALREHMEAAPSGFYLMGYRVTLHGMAYLVAVYSTPSRCKVAITVF
jgi:hypothetical protein